MKAKTARPKSTVPIKKALHEAFKKLFEKSGKQEIEMPLESISSDLLAGAYNRDYVKKSLEEMGYIQQACRRKTFPRINPDGTCTDIHFHSRYYYFHINDLQNK